MKLLLIAPAGLEVQGVKGKHVHHLNLAVVAALAEPYFDIIKIVEEEFEALDLNESADLVGITMMTCQAPRGYWIADHFRRRGVRVICGGSRASFMVEESGKKKWSAPTTNSGARSTAGPPSCGVSGPIAATRSTTSG